jgi:phosphoribosylaminoimidazole-succinocarboxamide synthase
VTKLEDYRLIATGKVRELYGVDDEHLLFVASDRISAYDHVLRSEIPDKGRVLTAMSVFWFELLADLVPNHLVTADDPRIPAEVAGRALLVRRMKMQPVECVARGYLSGSGLRDYQRTGEVSGIALPDGLVEGSPLPEPIFTPSTKAEQGQHDEAISYERVVELVGAERAAKLRQLTVDIYRRAAEHAETRGVILADTKFEFGVDADGQMILADEVLTPDSSRYWPRDSYEPGKQQPSFDKQFVRDWLTSPASGWTRDSGEEPPALPAEIVDATRSRYVEGYERITGRSLDAWLG